MSSVDLWTLGLTHWSVAPAPDTVAAASLLAYGLGVRRMRGRWPAWRTVSFTSGVLAGILAVQSGYDAFDDRLLSVHMVQHLLLLEVAPLLALGGRPAMLMLRAAPAASRPRLARGLRRLGPLTHPLTCLAVFWIVLLGAHTPWFFDATLAHPLVHEGEHVAFLGAGLIMWWPLLDGDPVARRRLGGLARLSYVMAAMVPMTVIGAWLNRDDHVVYTPYLAPAHAMGLSAVVDQQQAGAIMWVVGSGVMIAAGIWQAMAALVAEERRLQQRERRMDVAEGRAGELT